MHALHVLWVRCAAGSEVKVKSFFCSRLSGRYAIVAFRKVNFNQIPKIIPKIPVSDCITFLALYITKHD